MDQKKREREQQQQEKERDQAERKRKCAENLQQVSKSKYKCTSEHVREPDDSQMMSAFQKIHSQRLVDHPGRYEKLQSGDNRSLYDTSLDETRLDEMKVDDMSIIRNRIRQTGPRKNTVQENLVWGEYYFHKVVQVLVVPFCKPKYIFKIFLECNKTFKAGFLGLEPGSLNDSLVAMPLPSPSF